MTEKDIAKLVASGNINEARKRLEEAKPSLPESAFLNLLALVEAVSGNRLVSESIFLDAIQRFPEDLAPAANYASQLMSQGRYKDAIPFARKVWKSATSKSIQNVMPLVTAYLDSAQVEKAREVLNSLPDSEKKKREPKMAEAACLRHLGEYDAAEHLGKELLEEYPCDSTVARMYADLIGEQGLVNPIPLYDRALALAKKNNKSSLSTLKWNMSLHLLRHRDFERGWSFYEEGFSATVGTLGRSIPQQLKLSRQVKDLESMDPSRWTVVCVEQGIGDQILFLSALPQLLEKTSKVLLLCEDRLKPIIQRSFPGVLCLSPGGAEYIDRLAYPFNGILPIGRMYGFFRPDATSFIRTRKPFLKVNREKYLYFRNRLKSMAGSRPVVGLSWKGGFWENQKRNKAVELQEWEPVLRRDLLAISLQYGDIESDIRWAKAHGYDILQFDDIDFKKDLDSWLALAAACDGIISVSTALVHFAGAVNQKVAVVIPQGIGPWILGIEDTRSIQYPNVYYFRREAGESLEALLSKVSSIIVN